MAGFSYNNDKPDCDSDSSSFAEKRCGRDRRTHQFPKIKYLLFSGRRARARRQEDRYQTFYFDRYSSRLFAAIMAILCLSVLDALLTLHLIKSGSTEINPLMSYFLKYGTFVFLVAKYFLTCTGVIILLLFRNAFLARSTTHGQHLFSYIIGVFGTVVVWELFLILFVAA
ncbi:MAG: DUF5658 family protein [Desulfobacterales bacterium]|jgi:hypothetical protein